MRRLYNRCGRLTAPSTVQNSCGIFAGTAFFCTRGREGTAGNARRRNARALLAGLAALIFAAAAAVAPGTHSALAQSGYDRPGGDYASAPVQSGDPAVCASRCERDKTCRAWSFSYPLAVGRARRCAGSSARWCRGSQSGCCVSGVRGAGVIEPRARRQSNIRSIAPAAITARSRRRRTRKGKACADACQGDKRCRAWTYRRPGYGSPPRVVISRRRSSRRAIGRAAFPAWCDSAPRRRSGITSPR